MHCNPFGVAREKWRTGQEQGKRRDDSSVHI
jgi:hypothetical protein